MIPYHTYLTYLIYINLLGAPVDFATKHCSAMKSPSNLSSCNRVCGQGKISGQEIDQIIAYYGATPFKWFMQDTDVTLSCQLTQKGLILSDTFPAMIFEGKIQPIEYAYNVRVERVTNEQALQSWITICATCFAKDIPEFTKFIHHLLKSNSIKLYRGFYNNIPAACSMIIECESDLYGIHWVGTLPECRNKGLGNAVVHKALLDVAQHKSVKALLFASPLGKPIYEKLGFKEYANYKVYERKV